MSDAKNLQLLKIIKDSAEIAEAAINTSSTVAEALAAYQASKRKYPIIPIAHWTHTASCN